jgi:hypothetical protein
VGCSEGEKEHPGTGEFVLLNSACVDYQDHAYYFTVSYRLQGRFASTFDDDASASEEGMNYDVRAACFRHCV